MTDTEQIVVPTPSVDSHFRAFSTQLERTSPRELSGRLVPFDVAELVGDDRPTGIEIYKEGFRRGAFERQFSDRGSFKRVSFVHTHEAGGLGYLGSFVMIRAEADGLYGNVQLMPSKADDVQALVDAGIDELSVEFRLPKRPGIPHTVEADGVRWRVNAHLDRVALEPKGAYSGARVLQIRAELDEIAQQRVEAQEHEAELAAAQAAIDAERVAEAEAAKLRRARWDELAERATVEEQRSAEYRRQFGISLT